MTQPNSKEREKEVQRIMAEIKISKQKLKNMSDYKTQELFFNYIYQFRGDKYPYKVFGELK